MLQKLWSHFVSATALMAGLRKERDHHFYQGALNSRSLVLDLGLHKGQFSRFVSLEYGCSVVGLEANPSLYKVLEPLPRAQFMNLAISQTNSSVLFNISANPEAGSVLEEMTLPFGVSSKVEVPGITLDTLFVKLSISRVDLLKVDIEGSEFDMLAGASEESLSKVAQITVEFHLKPGSASFTPDRVMLISRRLRKLGFQTFFMDRNLTDVLFLNFNLLCFTPLERFALALYRFVIMPVRILIQRQGSL